MQKQLNEIMQKRMDRKDFLKHVAMGVAVITGAAGVIKLMKPDPQPSQGRAPVEAAYGYGTSVYGGRQAATQPRRS